MYKCVDLTKLFFSICIVFIHTHALALLSMPQSYYFEKCILRIAVPYFFIISGYLFIDTLSKSKNSLAEKMFKQIRRLLKPFIVFSIINTTLNAGILLYTKQPHPWGELLQHFFFYPYGALWYVLATMLGLLLLYPFIKSQKWGLVLCLGLGLYSFALLCNSYYFVASELYISNIIDSYLAIFISARNALFVGFLFIGLGMILAHTNIPKHITFHIAVFITLFSFAIYTLEIYYLRKYTLIDDGGYFISSPLMGVSLALLTLKTNLNIADRISVLCRNLSVGIFFLHSSISTALQICAFVLFGRKPSQLGGGLFLLTLFICITICLVVYKFKKEPFYSLLK